MTSSLRELTDALRIVSNGEGEVRNALSVAVQHVGALFNHTKALHLATSQLADSGSISGAAADEVAAAARRWAVVHEQVAEVGQLLLSIAPRADVPWSTSFKDAARSGATAKRLAEWEEQWLRSEVVTVLAGDKP